MGLFGLGKKTNEGGLMDAINIGDVKNYLIWKWRPKGQGANSTNKENAIRTGSSLLVNEGQAAIFIYPNSGGKSDVRLGYFNGTIETGNMPVLANIIGKAYDGGTPFQAQVYFITLYEGGMQVHFTVPYFTVRPSQKEFSMYNIEMAVDGTLTFAAAPTDMQMEGMYMYRRQNNMTSLEYEDFRIETLKEAARKVFRMWGGKDTTMEDVQDKILAMVTSSIKGTFSKIPQGVFVLQANEMIEEWQKVIYQKINTDLCNTLGLWPTRLDITDIRFKENSEDYQQLKDLVSRQAYNISMQNQKNLLEQLATDAAVRNGMVIRQANIQMDHMEDMMDRMREESQYAQHMQTDATMHRTALSSEQSNLGAHTVNVQGDVMRTGMENIGNMGMMDFGNGGGMNPAGMMMGMGMASGMAGQMGQMMGNMGNAFNNQVTQGSAPTPPPMPGQTPPAPPTPNATAYFVLVNNQQAGPFDANTLRQMAAAGQINLQTMVWAQGMPQWAAAGTIPALAQLLQTPPAPPTPPTPPIPGSVPPPPPVR
ncbi:MAG: DUF4339 domain-containing protein [Paludibacteraceae bacterium]|nr:DUF4339 domain-containing protein [Paludibacteraceae bacterium]